MGFDLRGFDRQFRASKALRIFSFRRALDRNRNERIMQVE
jgi:hypothetical protein